MDGKSATNITNGPGVRESPAQSSARAAVHERPRKGRVLMIVENLPVPFDRRVWAEATALQQAGYVVSVICPQAKGLTENHEVIDGISIYRHPLPIEAKGALGYLLEYSSALYWEFVLSFKVHRRHGFDVIHACNPPDLIFLIGAFWKIFGGKKFIFDHHDLNPELFEAKFKRRGLMWRLLLLLERLTFLTADISIATNESYRRIALLRGQMSPERVFTVRSGPNLDRVRKVPPSPRWKRGRAHLVAYVGVIGEQEGLDLLLDAVEHIVRRRGRTDLQFVIVGSGPHWSAIESQTEQRQLGDFVTLTGTVEDAILFEVLSTADVCVNPDRPNAMNDLSTMNKVMEYMALGRPIVQFDLTEGRVSAQDASVYARNTDTADFGDKILQLIDDPVQRDAMGERGVQRIENELAWHHEVPKLLAAYDAVFRLRRRRRHRQALEAPSPGLR
jgi:glycosyltransferase involved in cell wall biosynthesis